MPDCIKHIYLLLKFLISSFISSYSFSTLSIETNSSWLILEFIKDLEIKTSLVFNLAFTSKTILSCFFFFFLITDLYLLVTVIMQIFIVTVELPIHTGIPTKEAKAEMETHPVTVKAKISKCSV